MPQPHSHAILFEMLRSFTTLAHTLNLSKAVRVLGSTRQTVRRHIDILEDIRGEKLFKLQDRQYNLTEAGSQSLHEAEILLSRGEAWLTGRTKTVGLAGNWKDGGRESVLITLAQPVGQRWGLG